jgi:predicted nucleic acid-binding protein
MEVMLDTNVLFSAILFPSERMNALFSILTKNHSIVLCSYGIETQAHRHQQASGRGVGGGDFSAVVF